MKSNDVQQADLYYLFLLLTHWKKKYTRTAKAGGLNGLTSAKDLKNLLEYKKALTKIITIQLNQERKRQSEEKTYK